jgi:hypothetical protein
MNLAILPFAVFLINETTKDLFVLPPDAATSIEGAKPCASMKTTITASAFTEAHLDQMCASLAQGLLPKIKEVLNPKFSAEHAKAVGRTIRTLQTLPPLRAGLPPWPPEIPFTLSGLTDPQGLSLVFGVRMASGKSVVLERIDVWSRVDEKFTRAYWSRAMNDPTYSSSPARVMTRMGLQIQRAWKSQPQVKERAAAMTFLVDKRISERELSVIENVVRSQQKDSHDGVFSPVEVHKSGIVYRSTVAKAKQTEIVSRLTKELPAFQTRASSDESTDVSILLSAPR